MRCSRRLDSTSPRFARCAARKSFEAVRGVVRGGVDSGELMGYEKTAVRKILDQAKAAGRSALTAPEAAGLCEAYGIAVPQEGVAATAADAAKLAAKIGFPVVMKIVSPQ